VADNIGKTLQQVLKQAVNKDLNKAINIYKEDGKLLHEKIRHDIYENWYNGYDGALESMWNATEQMKPKASKTGEDEITITFGSYIIPSAYTNKSSADAWKRRHPGVAGRQRSGSYVMDLQLETHDWGASIALPPRSGEAVTNAYKNYYSIEGASWSKKQRPWTNPIWDKVGKDHGLKEDIFNPANWEAEWLNGVKEIEKKIK